MVLCILKRRNGHFYQTLVSKLACHFGYQTLVTFHKWLDNEEIRSSYQSLVTWDFVRYLPCYFLTKSYQSKLSFELLFFRVKFWKISFFWVSIQICIDFYSLTHQILCSSSPISLFSCWMLCIHTYGVSFTMPMILDCHEQYGQVSVF